MVCVANRLPVVLKEVDGEIRITPSSGGLVSALSPILCRGKGVWIGADTLGDSSNDQNSQLLRDFSNEIGFSLIPVPLTKADHEGFYNGFSNRIIWPLFHDLQSRCNFDPTYWEAYQIVNKKFADVVVQNTKEDDLLWINDYHLIGLASQLRALGLKNSLSFFLHIPFPAPDLFMKLPWREEIMKSLMSYEVIGLQTEHDVSNFLDCISYMTSFKAVSNGAGYTIKHDHGEVYLQHFPISIDVGDFLQRAELPEIKARSEEIKREVGVEFLAVSVDRLDYTKGVPNRIKAFARLLQRVPELKRKVALLQVLVPSREEVPEYQEMREEVDKLVSQVNGEFAEPGWIPVQHFARSITKDELIALYLAADVGLVTPLKDGMNLVAKEFTMIQADGNAALVLSEFAGAAEELKAGAILVNPYDIDGVADALRNAFLMPQEEKISRMTLMQNQIIDHDVFSWADDFLSKSTWTHKLNIHKNNSFSLSNQFRRLISVFDM